MKKGARRRQIEENLSKPGKYSRLAELPTEILSSWFREMNFKAISGFVLSNKKPNHALSGRVIQNFWQPCLQALHQMDSTVPLQPPAESKDIGRWYYAAVMQSSHAIYNRQCEEVKYLKDKHPELNLIPALNFVENNDANINLLTARHHLLNEINCALIWARIDVRSTDLNLRHLGITRIPDGLFQDQRLTSYWQTLESLDCNINQLRELPEAIGNLVALQIFFCEHNILRELPNSLRNKYGVFWSENTLRSQNQFQVFRAEQPVLVPRYAQAQQQAQTQNRRRIRETEIEEIKREANGFCKRPK